MKKYIYKYCVYTNNMCAGILFIKAFDNVRDALFYKEQYQQCNGCCDVVRKRFIPGTDKPLKRGIYGLTRYYL